MRCPTAMNPKVDLDGWVWTWKSLLGWGGPVKDSEEMERTARWGTLPERLDTRTCRGMLVEKKGKHAGHTVSVQYSPCSAPVSDPPHAVIMVQAGGLSAPHSRDVVEQELRREKGRKAACLTAS